MLDFKSVYHCITTYSEEQPNAADNNPIKTKTTKTRFI